MSALSSPSVSFRTGCPVAVQRTLRRVRFQNRSADAVRRRTPHNVSARPSLHRRLPESALCHPASSFGCQCGYDGIVVTHRRPSLSKLSAQPGSPDSGNSSSDATSWISIAWSHLEQLLLFCSRQIVERAQLSSFAIRIVFAADIGFDVREKGSVLLSSHASAELIPLSDCPDPLDRD